MCYDLLGAFSPTIDTLRLDLSIKNYNKEQWVTLIAYYKSHLNSSIRQN